MKYPKEMWVKPQSCKLSPKKTSELLEKTDKIVEAKKKKILKKIKYYVKPSAGCAFGY